MSTKSQPGKMCEAAALYALGALDPAESAAFQSHLESCAVCRDDVASLREVAQDLTYAIAPDAPPPRLRRSVAEIPRRVAQKLPASLAEEQPAHVLLEEEGLLISRPARRQWEALGIEGIWQKPLFLDSGRGYHTTLYRMEPGSRFPSHKHADAEELFMLEGDLTVNGVRMVAGDYCRASSGTQHSSAATENGCLVLVLSSDHNDLMHSNG